MKKTLHFFIFILCISGALQAQTPMHYNTNAAGGANSIPMAAIIPTWQKCQWYIAANSLVNPTPVGVGNNITVVYFQTGSATTKLYTNINVKLKQGAGTGLTGVTNGPIEPGMTTVYAGTNVNVVSTIGGWISFTLQTPWLYNPALPLIVELEQDSPNSGGPTVYQVGAITGPGNGRQWGNYNGTTLAGVGGQRINFGVDVLPATPCSGTPGPNSVVTPTAPICPNSSAQLGLANTYSFGGITYQWQYSNVSAVGPWTNVPGGTSPVINSPSLSATHYFNTIITCTNSNGSVTATSGTLDIAATTTNNVYYFEGFEGISQDGKLPNCSWNASHPNVTCFTYTNVQNQNRSPRTGQKYASFYFTPAQSSFFWSNGIWMEAGVTYSASMWYKTEYQTNPSWQLRMWTSPAQTTNTPGSNIIATSGGPGSAAAPSYISLSDTFMVATSGFYHVGINAISNGGTGYLTWDDLEIALPCQLNPVPLAINTITQTICAGTSINLTASGADTYLWSNGSTASAITVMPYFSTTYTVTGTSAITGCSEVQTMEITVLPTPAVAAAASEPTICAGKSTNLYALGASTYVWNNNSTSSNIVVSPASTTAYSVTGTNSYGCSATGVVNVVVNPLPPVSASGDNAGVVCEEDETILSGNGATTYVWTSLSSTQIGNPISVSPNISTTYTVTGTDQFGCSNSTTVQLSVTSCVGIKDVSTTSSGIKLYPNPNNGNFVLEIKNKKSNAIEVTDLAGRLMLELSSTSDMINIDMSTFANGVYYVKITSDLNSEVIKVIKN